MQPQRAPPAFGQHCKIAARLRSFDDSESVVLIGHRQVRGVIASDLQKDPSVWPTLVSLSGRMQKARAESQTSRHALRIAHRLTGRLQQSLVLVAHFKKSQ